MGLVSLEYLESLAIKAWQFQMRNSLSNQTAVHFNTTGSYVNPDTSVEASGTDGIIRIKEPGLYLLNGSVTVTATTNAPVLTLNVYSPGTLSLLNTYPQINMHPPTGGNTAFSAILPATQPVDIQIVSTGGNMTFGGVSPQAEMVIVRLIKGG